MDNQSKKITNLKGKSMVHPPAKSPKEAIMRITASSAGLTSGSNNKALKGRSVK